MVITALKADILLIHPEMLASSSTCNADPSEIVVLIMHVTRPTKTANKLWSQDDCKRVKGCKPNIIKGSNHYQSADYYASFGNKGSYEIVNNSSVGQYATKKKATLEK